MSSIESGGEDVGTDGRMIFLDGTAAAAAAEEEDSSILPSMAANVTAASVVTV